MAEKSADFRLARPTRAPSTPSTVNISPAFFGPTEPRIYGPRGDDDLVFYKSLFCSPCLCNYNLKMSRCVNPVCMRAITVDEVLRGIAVRFPDIANDAAPRAASL